MKRPPSSVVFDLGNVLIAWGSYTNGGGRMQDVYAQVLPGLKSGKTPEDAIYFVIGPEKQFVAWEEYLKSVEGGGVRFYRLYPRDFWEIWGQTPNSN